MQGENKKITIGANGTEYGNWMSMPVIKFFSVVTVIFLIAFLLTVFLWKNVVVSIITAILAILFSVLLIYCIKVRKAFSFNGGKVMDRIQQNLTEHLDFDGKGKILDVGCGSGPLSIRCAKIYPNAKITGIDYWGKMWDYSKSLCEKNANLEGVDKQCTFSQGDATKLNFKDEEFDVVVSNFVYHEVATENDKQKLIMESLRVLKKGGTFCIQDFFDREKMFGNIDELIKFLKNNGISEIYYEGNIDKKEWIPNFCISPIVIKDIGCMWGKK